MAICRKADNSKMQFRSIDIKKIDLFFVLEIINDFGGKTIRNELTNELWIVPIDLIRSQKMFVNRIDGHQM